MSHAYDAVVVGSGPNGLAAAITVAQKGRSVLVIEAADTVGGGTRSRIMPGTDVTVDVCSAVHPMALSSPFFAGARLEECGLEWVHPEIPLAHPFDDGNAALLMRSVALTARGLGDDEAAYRRLMLPLTREWRRLAGGILGPILRPPKHPILMARFGLRALRSAESLVRSFRGDAAPALLMGSSAHAMVPLDRPMTASFGLTLAAAAHAVGWPVARGGSQAIADAMVRRLESLGGEVLTGTRVRSVNDLPPARATFFDTTPGHLVDIAGGQMPARTRRAYRSFRHGAAAFKLDFIVDRPVPWVSEACTRAGTVHLGGSAREMIESEREVMAGRIPQRPFTIVGQQTRFDRSRAPNGGEAVWAYCHVPRGSTVDMTAAIEEQIERFAPGFRQTIVARHATTPAGLEAENPNYPGGDISAGVHDGLQLLFRPHLALNPYRTGMPGIYICSASTPPGAGVHGMGGYWAAKSALGRELR